jgi:hypothetical protein
MSNYQHDTKEELANFEDLWAKAQEEGVFKDVERKPFSPSSQTADVNYFGVISGNPSENIRDVDAEYWDKLHSLGSLSNDPSDIIREMLDNDDEIEAPGLSNKDQVDRVTNSPNPVSKASLGKDTDMNTPEGRPFDQADLEKLDDLKRKMHDLSAKIAEFAANGKKTDDLEGKLSALHKQVDDVSDLVSGASKKTLLGGK